MPFLVPALLALVSDAATLWINHARLRGLSLSSTSFDDVVTVSDQDDFHQLESSHVAFRTRYLAVLAAVRILLLLLPILFHSYTGTALRFPYLYRFLYWSTLLILIIHSLLLATTCPWSLPALLPLNVTNEHLLLLRDLRRIWWMLGLSLVADVCHLFLFMHVRSTAPNHPLLFGKTNTTLRPPSVYFALRSQLLPDDTIRSEVAVVPVVTTDDPRDNDDSVVLPEPALVHAMSGFVDDVQARFLRTKTDWSARLEDFTARLSHHNNQQQQQQQQYSEGTGTTSTRKRVVQSLLPSSPFRVLLHLFAYEDVFDNGKLDIAFDMDDGASMTFYVPQLLSFLLHGAVLNSPRLEEWILQKCRCNAHFAHRCYWFLRAWCLEDTVIVSTLDRSMSRQNSDSLISINSVGVVNNGGGAVVVHGSSRMIEAGGGLTPFLDEPALPQHLEGTSLCGGRVGGAAVVGASGASHASSEVVGTPTNYLYASSKLLPEERAMIERLMLRVKECGEVAAMMMEFGTTNAVPDDGTNSCSLANSPSKSSNGSMDYKNTKSNNNNGAGNHSPYKPTSNVSPPHSPKLPGGSTQRKKTSPTNHLSAADLGTIPIDPTTGSFSAKHLECISSPRTFGFLPLPEDAFQTNRSSCASAESSGANCSSGESKGETEFFDKTPRFLDALMYMAESLFLVPKFKRKQELTKQLRMLECALLPSNSVYLPIGNIHHRVWRIVVEESIPIGTKERVPCIVCLEVVDYSPKRRRQRPWAFLDRLPRRGQRLSSSSTELPESMPTEQVQIQKNVSEESVETSDLPSELETVYEWRYQQRDPLRRSSFIDKVSNTIKGPLDLARGQINSLRDQLVSEEHRALTLSEAFDETGDDVAERQSFLDHSSIQTILDIESGLKHRRGGTSKPETNGNDRPTLSRASSGNSVSSMGQWSSPAPLKRPISQTATKRLDDAQRGLSPTEGSESPPLRYGSDEEDRGSEVRREFSRPNQALSKVFVRRPVVVFRESWEAKQERVRKNSAFGSHPGWRLLPVLIKANDDLRQEQLASQLIYRMAAILAREKVPVWLCPYEILALSDRGGIIEAIPDTISLDSLKRNDPAFTTLRDFFISHYGSGTDEFADAQGNFLESLAAYCIVCFLLQLKDRHNGNILLDNRGHIIHIDFGYFFLSSPGKNVGFESAPFKLTRDFVDMLGGPQSRLFRSFRELCIKTFITLRRHCMEIILLVEMLKTGNEELNCFRGRPDEAIRQLRDRFRLDLNDRACREYVNSLVDNSIENWRTDWYDRYQRYFVGIL